MNTQLDQAIRSAITAGLLPAGATRPAQDTRPWPVVLLTGLGAWLAAIPLLGVVGILLGDMITRSVGPYVVGLLVLAGALVVLRAREVPLFVEQLAVPALLVGGGTLAFGLYRDLPVQAASALLALVALAFARAVPPPWLRVLLGAAAAVLAAFACLPRHWELFDGNQLTRFGVAWHASLALWLLALGVQRRAPARDAAALESIAAGWLLATLAGLAMWSGMSFLVGASLGEPGAIAREFAPRSSSAWPLQVASVALSLAAAFALASTWPTLRRPWCAGVAAVGVGLAWFMPALGAVLLALALCAATQRWRLASAAALAAAWIVGSFYYQLHWPLADKALVLVGAAALLAALAWWAPRTTSAREPHAPTVLPRAARVGIGATALAVLAVANLGIWQKEQLIAHGQPVYVELAPVDPRSLMQGDFMRLNFSVPGGLQTEIDGLLTTRRPKVVVRLDERGVAKLLRLDTGAPLAAGERRVELTPKDGRWVFVSDAWFFKEGEGERWARAKYGEFRVSDDGRALLVGLRGADLQPL
ncbi:MAG TPA: GDYXXLXY domain-containing protein [Albitalea sp.]|nr:GDYXXLXY domain-containing protein [Albitalea sp.]